MRIVSLLASATEILDQLGLSDQVVGISHECDFPPHLLDRPRLSRTRFAPEGLDSGAMDAAVRRAMEEFGGVYELDASRLASLRPDLILTQAVCDVCAVPTAGVRETVAELGLDSTVLSLDAHTLEEILQSVGRVGAATGVEERAQEVARSLRQRISAVRTAVRDRSQPRVLAVEWLDPPFTPGHWVPEMITTAGGVNLAGTAGARSQQTTWERMAGLDPDVLLVMPCGYDVERARQDADKFAARLVSTAPRAVGSGRAYLVDGSSYFNRSGPRVVTGIEILAALLHPGMRPLPDAAHASVWAGP